MCPAAGCSLPAQRNVGEPRHDPGDFSRGDGALSLRRLVESPLPVELSRAAQLAAGTEKGREAWPAMIERRAGKEV